MRGWGGDEAVRPCGGSDVAEADGGGWKGGGEYEAPYGGGEGSGGGCGGGHLCVAMISRGGQVSREIWRRCGRCGAEVLTVSVILRWGTGEACDAWRRGHV